MECLRNLSTRALQKGISVGAFPCYRLSRHTPPLIGALTGLLERHFRHFVSLSLPAMPSSGLSIFSTAIRTWPGNICMHVLSWGGPARPLWPLSVLLRSNHLMRDYMLIWQ